MGEHENRGLKPTATIIETLRVCAGCAAGRGFGGCRGATSECSRGFQPTVRVRGNGVRRVATGEESDMDRNNYEEVLG